ncbi:hypothetical protein [Rubritalea marina]|uniref:hypothetical protein n=1 Tax=Rubritalea marina TaxID=361055 RepID=UPI00035DC5BD|nr:hypothetical protein [Rubritalea marina]
MFESIELSEEVEELVDQLEEASNDRALSREERAVIDVVDTVKLIAEGEGLNEFWLSGTDHSRAINSFELIGASTIVDTLNASQWCQAAIEDRSQYSSTEAEYISGIEEEYFEALQDLTELLNDFIEEEL